MEVFCAWYAGACHCQESFHFHCNEINEKKNAVAFVNIWQCIHMCFGLWLNINRNSSLKFCCCCCYFSPLFTHCTGIAIDWSWKISLIMISQDKTQTLNTNSYCAQSTVVFHRAQTKRQMWIFVCCSPSTNIRNEYDRFQQNKSQPILISMAWWRSTNRLKKYFSFCCIFQISSSKRWSLY